MSTSLPPEFTKAYLSGWDSGYAAANYAEAYGPPLADSDTEAEKVELPGTIPGTEMAAHGYRLGYRDGIDGYPEDADEEFGDAPDGDQR